MFNITCPISWQSLNIVASVTMSLILSWSTNCQERRKFPVLSFFLPTLGNSGMGNSKSEEDFVSIKESYQSEL